MGIRKLFITTLGVLLLPAFLIGADKKISELTADNAPTAGYQVPLITTSSATRRTVLSTVAGALDHTDLGAGIGTNTHAQIDTALATVAVSTQTNATNIATNVTNIAAVAVSTGTNTTGIATNVTNIAAVAVSTGTNTTNIATNVTNIATNVTNIAAVAVSTGTNTTAIDALELSTGTINTSLSSVILSTGTIQTSLSAVILSTGTIQTSLDAVIVSTGTFLTAAVETINAAGETALTGAVTITGGTNVTLTQVGQDIEIVSTGGSGGTSTLQVQVDDVEITSPTVSINFLAPLKGSESPSSTSIIELSTAAVTNGAATIPNGDQVFDFCETTQGYLKTDESESLSDLAVTYGVAAATGAFSGQVTSNGRNLVDQYHFAVTISTPYALGTGANVGYCISPARDYAITITTMTAFVSGGTNAVLNVETRAFSGLATDGTEVWSGDVTALTTRTGGAFASAGAVAADLFLFLDMTSVSGDVNAVTIHGTFTKD